MMKAFFFLQPKTQIKLAIFSSLLSSLSFVVMLTLSKVALHSSSINEISFFKSFFSLILTFVFLFFCKKEKSCFAYLKTTQLKIHVIRSVSGLATIYLFLLALDSISLAEANLLFNTTPLFVPLVAFIWKKTPINHKMWPGLFVAFLGLIFLLHPQIHLGNSGIWIALLAGVIGAITIIAVRFSHGSEPVCRSIFYYGIFSLLFSGILYAVEGFSLSPLWNPSTAFTLFGIGASGFSCQLFFTLSVKYAPAKLIAPFSYAAVVFGLGVDLIFWQVKILPSEIFGILLMLTGLYFVASLFYSSSSIISTDSRLKEYAD